MSRRKTYPEMMVVVIYNPNDRYLYSNRKYTFKVWFSTRCRGFEYGRAYDCYEKAFAAGSRFMKKRFPR